MAVVAELLAFKGNTVYCVTPDQSVHDATRKMNQHKLGAVCVTDPDDSRRLVGIFTERDVLRRVVAELRSPDRIVVRDVMTQNPVVCTPLTRMCEVSQMMRDKRVRHLPVLDDEDGRLVGLISIGDLNAWHLSEKEREIEQLNDYVCGRG